MNWGHHTRKSLGFIAFLGFVLTGTYNAVVINSDSSISSKDIRFVKRLDEVYGVVTPGRMVAASTTIKKLKNEDLKADPIVQIVRKLDSAPTIAKADAPKDEPAAVAAAVQEELELSLMEVINPKKWPQGLAAGSFSGNLSTNGGVIESLSVSLPNGEGISVEFSEMSGNVFEYDFDGEVFSGMLYQVDQNSYMVTLTNGPMEGTRLRFNRPTETQDLQLDVQQEVAQEQPVDSGNFGAEQVPPQTIVEPDPISAYDQAVQAQASSYNMEQPQT